MQSCIFALGLIGAFGVGWFGREMHIRLGPKIKARVFVDGEHTRTEMGWRFR